MLILAYKPVHFHILGQPLYSLNPIRQLIQFQIQGVTACVETNLQLKVHIKHGASARAVTGHYPFPFIGSSTQNFET